MRGLTRRAAGGRLWHGVNATCATYVLGVHLMPRGALERSTQHSALAFTADGGRTWRYTPAAVGAAGGDAGGAAAGAARGDAAAKRAAGGAAGAMGGSQGQENFAAATMGQGLADPSPATSSKRI
jgi:hypothetical protein